MKLGVAHELGLGLAALLATLIVLLGGELPLVAWLVCTGPIATSMLALRGVLVPPQVAPLVGGAGIAVGALEVAQRGLESAVLAATLVLLGLLLARLLVRRTPEHDLQALLLSLLLVLAGTVLNVGPSFIVILVPYAVAVVWALSTRQLIAGMDMLERPRLRARTDVVTPAFFAATGLVSLAVLASAVLLFAVFPRVGFGELGGFLTRESRIPDAVVLGGDARGRGGTAVVARATRVGREAFDAGLYLRGAVYDVVTLAGFSRSGPDDVHHGGAIALGPAPIQGRYEVTALPVVGDTLLAFGPVLASRVVSGGTHNPNLTLAIAGANARDELKAVAPLRAALRYEVAGGFAQAGHITEVRRPPAPLSPKQRARYLTLPPEFDAVLSSLAREAAGSTADARARADHVRRFLLERFQYGLDIDRSEDAPVLDFLLADRRGHCELFAAAFALLLRSQGIPARVVGGFQGGAWDDGVIVFQERHAHAWVEWWLDDVGWIVDDATPSAARPLEELARLDSLIDRARRFWDDMVLDYSVNDQMDALANARRSWRSLAFGAQPALVGIAIPAGVAALLVAVVALRRRAARSRDESHPLAAEILGAVARSARTDVTPAMTVREAVALVPGPPALIDALIHALDDYERARFDQVRLDAAAVRRHRRALRAAGTARRGDLAGHTAGGES